MANVSIATVSRTINRVSTVNPKMAKRVWKAIENLDGFPNTQARALLSGRGRLLGLCSNEMTAIGVLHKLYRAGCKVPDDLSAIGFDDIHMAQVMIPRSPRSRGHASIWRARR
jgi:DNA-binding LacI/PurR family transcriptional regulator